MVTRRKRRERDFVAELQEDARWSSYTNSIIRWPWTVRGSLSSARFPGPGLLSVLLAAILFVGIVLGVIALLLFLVRVLT